MINVLLSNLAMQLHLLVHVESVNNFFLSCTYKQDIQLKNKKIYQKCNFPKVNI